MKRYPIQLAGLMLAATLLPSMAQGPRGGVTINTGPKNKTEERVELDLNDENGPIAIARSAVGDMERNVRKIFTAGPEQGERPLIVTTSSVDPTSLANLDEDITIMARILDKSVDRGRDDDDHKAMGIQLWALGGGGRGARNLYLDGYGAVFVRSVNMPLQAPVEKTKVEEKKEPANSTWEEARNEVFGREDERREVKTKKSAQPFDAKRVEELKNNLAEALKNATHIRGLKDNEHVTIVLQGPGSGASYQRVGSTRGQNNAYAADAFAYAFSGGGPSAGPRSVMTLRAKKSDIDAFAKNKLDADDFRKKVAIYVYQTPGGNGDAAGEGASRR